MNKLFVKKATSIILALAIFGFPAGMYAAQKDETIAPENKITEKLYLEFDRLKAKEEDFSKVKIPVWIWYKDVDQKEVDREVTQITGLTQEDLTVNFEMPSLALINNLKNGDLGSQQQMRSYLTRTVAARELENRWTDEYIMKRREISKKKYNGKSDKLFKNIIKNDSDIIFKSQYAPMLIVRMTQKDIINLSKNEIVESIDFYDKVNDAPSPTFVSTKETLKLDKVRLSTGLTGKNVKVGMFEYGVPLDNDELESSRVTKIGKDVDAQNHPMWVAICLAGSKSGIAPEASLYVTDDSYENIESLINQGVKVINASWGQWAYGYTNIDKWFDHIATYHNLLVVCSAGNEEDDGRVWVRTPAMASNTIAVGALEDNSSGNDLSDDLLYIGSSYNHTGFLKPDLVAPMNTTNGATSFAAPIVTGIAALLLELKPSLAHQPQVLKAILMASCQRKVLSHAGKADEKMEQGITRTQGAGAIDAWNAVCIVAQGNYGYGEVKDMAEKRNFIQPSYGASHMNVSIAWLRENTVPENDHIHENTAVAGTQHNLDLRVYRNGGLVGSSLNTNSSTEMAYFPLSASESRYQIKVNNYNLTGTDYPEGIYYIRSKANANGAYLTVNEETGQVTQEPFTGEANQQWVSGKTGSNPFTIRTNAGGYPGYLSIQGQTLAWIRQDSEQYITYGGNTGNNTYSIGLYGLPASSSRSLTALDSGAQSAPAVWQNIGIPERYLWYFEPVGYKRGDVNRDGTISSADSLLLQRYIGGLASFDTAQEFLGDMNNDGKVDQTDLNLIRQAVAG